LKIEDRRDCPFRRGVSAPKEYANRIGQINRFSDRLEDDAELLIVLSFQLIESTAALANI